MQAEVSFFAVIQGCRLDANTIVLDEYSKIVPIFQPYFQPTPPRVGAGIADGLVTNTIELVADNGMYLLWVSGHVKEHLHRINQSTLFRRPLEGFREVVLLRGCDTERDLRSSPFLDCLSQPIGHVFHCSSHLGRVR